MNDFLFDLGISAIITTLRGLKGPQKKKQLRAVFLKVNKLIAGTYGDDKEFSATWGVSDE